MRETNDKNPCTILMADDDPDDRYIVEQIFQTFSSGVELRFVEDGEELMNYLRRFDKYAGSLPSPRPALILLDLNMPGKDGRQALAEIKEDPDLREIPVAIWTTSKEREDKMRCEDAGADFYVTKPETYPGLSSRLQELVGRFCSEGDPPLSADG